MREKITQKLLELGIKPSLKGFYYLVDAIEICADDRNAMIGDVYKQIAESNMSTYSRVERSVRHAITKVDFSSKEIVEFLNANKRLTSKEFITIFALKIKE